MPDPLPDPMPDPTPEPEFSQTMFQVRAAQQGDRGALDDLLTRYRPRLCKAVAIMLGPTTGPHSDIDDAVQEVLLAAYQHLGKYAPRSDATFMNWLMTIVMHKVRDRHRHDTRKKRGAGQVQSLEDLPASTTGEPALPTLDPTVSQMVRAHEIADAERVALLQLADHHRELIVDREVLGMTYEEMARKRGYHTADPARALYSRARRKLAQMLKRFDETAQRDAGA